MKNLVLMIISMMLMLAGTAHAGGDAAIGKEKSVVCQSCHGVDGNSVAPNYPKLAGQYEDYLYLTLQHYKSGVRNNAIMSGMVAALSEEDMKNLAAYFASQKGLIAVDVGMSAD